jgi:hypothetical protein
MGRHGGFDTPFREKRGRIFWAHKLICEYGTLSPVITFRVNSNQYRQALPCLPRGSVASLNTVSRMLITTRRHTLSSRNR